MARYLRNGEGEPLLRVERPSSPSNQTTAHVISGCFNEILTRKPLDAKEINNMVVSKNGEDQYHDKYVERLKKINDKYDRQMENLKTLEQHLLQAKTKALVTEEKLISIKDVQIERTGLPRELCLLSQYLNEDLLAQCDLLLPSQYHPKIHISQSPPKKSFPSYLKPTVTFNLHATVPIDVQQLASAGENMASREKFRKNNTTDFDGNIAKPCVRTSSARGVVSVCMQPVSTTSTSHFSARNKPPLNHDLTSVHKKPERCTYFVAEPHEIVFTNYIAGQAYECPLILRNISMTSQQLHVLPPHTSYFSICIDNFPNAEGSVAPGMHCSYMVRFTPDSLADFTDCIKVLMHSGLSMSVPLKGRRPAPELSLPCVLDCGYCFTGSIKSISIECSNNGGEGSFHFQIPQEAHPTNNECASLCIGPFVVSPVSFHLSSGAITNIQISFSPTDEGEHLEDLNLIYDNCHIQTFQLRGTAEHVEIGCISFRLSSVQEIAAFSDDKIHGNVFHNDGVSNEDTLEHPKIIFDPTNPGQPVFKTVILKNFSNMDIHFQWKCYRPNALSFGKNPDVLAASTTESKMSVFTVRPSCEIFKPREAKTFVFRFMPDKAGDYEDIAHLLVHDIPDLCLKASLRNGSLLLESGQFSAVSVFLHGHCECYALEFIPPIVNILEGIPFGTEVRKKFKIANPNHSLVEYCWSSYVESSVCSITVDPSSGIIGSGSVTHCELIIAGNCDGPIRTGLLCSIKHCDIPLCLQIEIHVQPPVVYIDVPSLDFGLISLGNSGVLHLPIRSETNAALLYELRQKISDPQNAEYMDSSCLIFAAPKGELQPYGTMSVTVECKPGIIGRLRSQVELLIENKVIRCVEVRAEIQTPIVHLKNCVIHEEKAYVQTGVVKEVVLINDTLITTQFTWSSQLLGQSAEYCDLRISPPTGRIGPRESCSLSLVIKWSKEGIHSEAVATCFVQGMDKPLFLLLSAEVFGISVHYSIHDGTTSKQSLSLDFGSKCSLKRGSTMFLVVRNTSAIKTFLSLHVVNFPASKPPTPPTSKDAIESSSHTSRRNTNLLHRTTDSARKSKDQITSDHISALLREGFGACFFIETTATELLPFESKSIPITAYSDMWGEYKDDLVCEARSLAPVTIPIKYDAVGCPVVFQATASSGQTTVRFGTHSVGCSPISRILKLKNLSPIEIRVDWQMFNNIQDDKLLDLIYFCGYPFPRKLAKHGVPAEDNMIAFLDDNKTDHQTLFQVVLKPHEGVRAADPFSIHPHQMILPAHGQGIVEIIFHPTVATLQNLGQEIVSYALGYFSIDQQANSNVFRLSGYDVEPLRIDITAGVTSPMLSLESDDEDLRITYPASIFIQENQLIEKVEKDHHFVLKNARNTDISFQIEGELNPHFEVTTASCRIKDNHIQLKPNECIKLNVLLRLSHGEFKDMLMCTGEVSLTEKVMAIFLSGFKQTIEVGIKIILPTLSISPTTVEFGTVFLGSSSESVVVLSNTTVSDTLWSLQIPSEFQHVLSATPLSGIIRTQKSYGNQQIWLSFRPSSESSYSCTVIFQNDVTGEIHQLAISGTGSANEKFCVLWQST